MKYFTVVLQKFDIQVYDVYAMKGSTAVFKCHVPSVLEEYVVVTSWIKNDNTLIQSSTDLGILMQRQRIFW